MLLTSGRPRTKDPSPSVGHLSARDTNEDVPFGEDTPPRFTHKMPLLPQPNCQRTNPVAPPMMGRQAASSTGGRFAENSLRGTRSQSNCTLPRPPLQRRTSEYIQLPGSCQRPKRKILDCGSNLTRLAPKSSRGPRQPPLPNCPAHDWVYYIGSRAEGKPVETNNASAAH